MPRRGGPPERLRDILAGILPRSVVGNAALIERFREAWERVVPEAVRAQTTVLGVKGAKVTIGVRSSPLLHELEGYARGALVDEVRRRMAPTWIENLVFRLEE